MTRIELKKMIYDVSKQDTSSPKDCIHLLSLHRFIEQIFDEHEAHVNDLRNAIDRYMEEAAMYKSILDKAEAQLKAKESDLESQDMIIKCLNIDLDNKEKLLKAKYEEIKELGEIVQQYIITSKNYDAIIKAKDEEIAKYQMSIDKQSKRAETLKQLSLDKDNEIATAKMRHKLEHDRYLITEAIIKEKDEEIERLKAELAIATKRFDAKNREGKALKKTLSMALSKQLKEQQ